MNKRGFLNALGGHNRTITSARPSPPSSSLAPYSGPWTTKHALHLLNRTTFGPTRDEVLQVQENGLDWAIDTLFARVAEPDPPIYFDFDQDPNVPEGETWVNTQPSNGAVNARRRSLTAWMMGNMVRSSLHIKEKMVLFWHEHFPVANVATGIFGYKYNQILRQNALGNFRTLLQEMTISDAMLLYLNGNENTRQAPNENYARELLELFTVGRGALAGPGDYTTFTEQDVEAMSRAVTGWRSARRIDLNEGARFTANRHDDGEKILSHRFDNAVISDKGAEEYQEVINLILSKKETGYHLARQLHIWFVSAEIDEAIEETIIRPLGEQIWADDYEVTPALMTLLRSEYFYEVTHRGCIISSPIDIILKSIKPLKFQTPATLVGEYNLWSRLFSFAAGLQMELMNLPEVAGWKAYYQEPQYSKFWINAFSLNRREALVEAVINLRDDAGRPNVDLISLIAEFGDDAFDANLLIKAITDFLFPFDISDNQLEFLIEVFLPGLPIYEWGVQYNEYLANPTDPILEAGVRNRLTRLFLTIIKMPEFQLI